jgi:hypothetical protein
MCPVITCAAMFPTNDLLLGHIAAHDSNVTLIQKRRKRVKTKAATEDDPSEHCCQGGVEREDFDFEDEIGAMYAGGSYLDDDDDDDDDYENIDDTAYENNDNDDDDDDDNDDDVYFIGHIRDGKRKRGRSMSVSSEKGNRNSNSNSNSYSNAAAKSSASNAGEKRFECPHPDCCRSFNQVRMMR